ncbi:hypothetical protein AURDEDRAFT_61328, partial [Auricularia subglabra TFB-10046 SS5]
FDFFDHRSPTNGNAEYVNKDVAMGENLTYINRKGQAVVRVDRTTHLAPGQMRKSVRLQSKKHYGNSLIAIDLETMPHGQSVWPAFWTLSAARPWPYGGEIDIVEGVNEDGNQMTLHTSAGCRLDDSARFRKLFTGRVLQTNCDVFATGNTGCGVKDEDPKSYGHEFNINGGGVFATLTDPSGIRIWRFARDSVPADLTDPNATPNPDAWPAPKAFWSADGCTREFIDQKQQMILNIEIGGDWASQVFNVPGVSLEQFVANPENYKWARFTVNWIRVYQHAS